MLKDKEAKFNEIGLSAGRNMNWLEEELKGCQFRDKRLCGKRTANPS